MRQGACRDWKVAGWVLQVQEECRPPSCREICSVTTHCTPKSHRTWWTNMTKLRYTGPCRIQQEPTNLYYIYYVWWLLTFNRDVLVSHCLWKAVYIKGGGLRIGHCNLSSKDPKRAWMESIWFKVMLFECSLLYLQGDQMVTNSGFKLGRNNLKEAQKGLKMAKIRLKRPKSGQKGLIYAK